jgi:hypothetical protein
LTSSLIFGGPVTVPMARSCVSTLGSALETLPGAHMLTLHPRTPLKSLGQLHPESVPLDMSRLHCSRDLQAPACNHCPDMTMSALSLAEGAVECGCRWSVESAGCDCTCSQWIADPSRLPCFCQWSGSWDPVVATACWFNIYYQMPAFCCLSTSISSSG